MKSLPERPSLDSLRKQAKKLARDVAAGDADAIARARAHLPNVDPPLTQRNAQFVVAREYGYAGWQELIAEVGKRLGNGLEWAVAQARRAIHDHDLDRLKQLLADYPALLSWQGDDEYTRGLVGFATGAYGDAYGEQRERWFTRGDSAEILIDAGAVVVPSVAEGILRSRAQGLLHLFHRKGLLPQTLEFFTALGDLDTVRTLLHDDAKDLATVNEAFVVACRFEQEEAASLLLERSTMLDADLRRKIDASVGRAAFLDSYRKHYPRRALEVGLWNAFVMERIARAIADDDLPAFLDGLRRDPWLLGDDWVDFQKDLVEIASFHNRPKFIVALFDLEPAILRRQPPPRSSAIEFAIVYAHNMDLIRLLGRVWPLPDDLPHAAGVGDLARVEKWFDESGAPALGDLQKHYPNNEPGAYEHFRVSPPSQQHVLDTALAFAVINRHFEIADFLLAHGADINTDWNSHEPASILHGLVFEENYESMQYLIDRGIDMTITDYRWDSTATGWARYGKSDEKMARWLEEAERRRKLASGVA